MSEKTIQVRAGKVLLSIYRIACGTLQGSIISPTLLNIMIHDLPKSVRAQIGITLFADDCAIWVKDRRIRVA